MTHDASIARIVYVALGSNLGDRGQALQRAGEYLRTLSSDGTFRLAPVIESTPVDCPPGSPPFLNTVAEIRWNLSARALLERLQAWEKTEGRPEVRPLNAPRPIDLDIIAFGTERIDEPDLIVPHPRAHERGFVLEPLCVLAPDLILPGQTQTVRELWDGWKKR